MKRRLHFFLGMVFVFVTTMAISQTAGKGTQKRALLIPFDRFEFYTEMKLSDINRINQMEGDQFFPALSQAFGDAFELSDFNRIRYVTISNEDYAAIKPYLKLEFKGKEGHYSSNLDQLHQNIYQQILDEYDCEFMIVFTWYRVFMTKESVKLKGLRKFGLYTDHLVDYDFYDDHKNLINFGSNHFMVEPSDQNLHHMGVRISELRPVYRELAGKISEHIMPH